ncbi:TetR family transcriptional regulator [Patulibacter sp. SYSU D01012]|uniref:TetR family transcriptional regulator n=1 Tax=Patulibacter sp. SYSU D01012 TaxID=2817381 RepID=UPI001B30EFC6
MARPSRRAERREDILGAAIALLERHDVAALRMGDVAAELGLTANAVRYYFKDVEALVTELALRSDVRFRDERLALVAAIDDPAEQLARVIEAGLPLGPEDAEWRAIWRAVLAAGFELDRHAAVGGIYHRQVAVYAQVVAGGADAGAFALAAPAVDVAMTLMSMEDYLGYRIVARDPLVDRGTALRLMRGYAEQATGATLPPAA